jgi:methylamine---glutamate N-methyltransferase subunit C
MGQKVTDQVAEMRSLPAGIDQRSPARHPDWLGPDDLALKINESARRPTGRFRSSSSSAPRASTTTCGWR